MNLRQYILTSPWAGDHLSLLSGLEALARVDRSPPEAEKQAQAYLQDDEGDEPFQGYGYMVEQINSLAVVNISGRLIAKSSWLSRLFGMSGYDEIANAVTAAAMEPGIENILLDIDSPGGSVSGLAEAADMIKNIDATVTPVSAFTSASMHSAAYWLGSAAREIHATEMASVGSIGVIGVHFDESERYKKDGIKPTVFTAGKNKGIGNPYEPLSDSDKTYMQEEIDKAYDFFVGAVAENRGLPTEYVREKVADGSTFYGQEAKDIGLIDSLNSFQDVVKLLDNVDNVNQPAQPGGI